MLLLLLLLPFAAACDCDPTGTLRCVNDKCICKNNFGGPDCSIDRSPQAKQQKVKEARKKALPTRFHLKQRRREIKKFARDTLREEIQKGTSIREAVRKSKMKIEIQDLDQEVQVIVSAQSKPPAIAVGPTNNGTNDNCPTDCGTIDISDDPDLTFLDTAEEVGTWTTLVNGDTIISKQTKVADGVYDMQCWDNGWGEKTTINTNGYDVGTTRGRMYQCNDHVILVGSQCAVCTPDNCLNGGTCNLNDDAFSCQCPDGFFGDRCEIASPSSCHELDCSDFGGHKANTCTNCSISTCCHYASKEEFNNYCESLTDSKEYVEAKCCHRKQCTPPTECSEGYIFDSLLKICTDDPCNSQAKAACEAAFRKPCTSGNATCGDCLDSHFENNGACTARQTCENYVCQNDLVLRNNAENFFCENDQCSAADNDRCCVALCSEDVCPADFVPKDNFESIQCSGTNSPNCTSEDIDVCCDERMTCSAGDKMGLSCPDNAQLKTGLCANATCAAGDFGDGTNCCESTFTSGASQTFSGMTTDDATPEFKDAFTNATADSLGTPPSSIQNVNATDSTARRLSERRLATSLIVSYDVVSTDPVQARAVQNTIKDSTSDLATNLMSKVVENLQASGADAAVIQKMQTVTAAPPVVTKAYKPFCKDEGPCSLKTPGVMPALVFEPNTFNSRCPEDGCSEDLCCRPPIIKSTTFMYMTLGKYLCDDKNFVKLDVTNFDLNGVIYEGVTIKQMCHHHILVDGLPEEHGNIFRFEKTCHSSKKYKWSYPISSILDKKIAKKMFCTPYQVTDHFMDVMAYMDMQGEIIFTNGYINSNFDDGFPGLLGIKDHGAEVYLVRDIQISSTYPFASPIILKSNGDVLTREGRMRTNQYHPYPEVVAKTYTNVKKVRCAWYLCLFLHNDGTVNYKHTRQGVDPGNVRYDDQNNKKYEVSWKDAISFYDDGIILDIDCLEEACWTIRNASTPGNVLIHTINTFSGKEVYHYNWAYTERELPAGTKVIPVWDSGSYSRDKTVCYLTPYIDTDPHSGSLLCPGINGLTQHYAKEPYWKNNAYRDSVPNLLYGPHPETGEMVDLWVPEFNNNGFIDVKQDLANHMTYLLLHKDGWVTHFGTRATTKCKERDMCPADFVKDFLILKDGKIQPSSTTLLSESTMAQMMEGENIMYDSISYMHFSGNHDRPPEGNSFISIDYD